MARVEDRWFTLRLMRQNPGLRYPVLVALVIYWLFTLGLLSASLAKTNGHFGYPLDDTYIHMAMARHLAQDGIWGISPSGFSSSSSSPLWTLLLAVVYRLLGAQAWIPLALCLLFGSATIVLAHWLLRDVTTPIRQAVYLVLIVSFSTLPVLTLVGMEHVLQSLVTLALTYLAAAYLADGQPTARSLVPLLLLEGLVTTIRYEGLFLVFSIALLCLIKRRLLAALSSVAAGVLVPVVYGIVSVLHGWYFIPNSVLLKGRAVDFSLNGPAAFVLHLPSNLKSAPQILVLLIACLILYLGVAKRGTADSKERYLVTIFVMVSLLHLQFATVGWLSRYEGYLMVTGSVIVFGMVDSVISGMSAGARIAGMADQAAAVALVILLISPLVLKMGENLLGYPLAVKNVYEQQYQMGLFLQKYYSGKPIAINDVGAVDYLGDVHTLDLAGIGSMEVARATIDGSFGEDTIGRLSTRQGTEVAILYSRWYTGQIPPDWTEVGQWTISDNVICADSVVTIYAPGARWLASVTSNLRAFSRYLPPTVEQSGSYFSH